MGNLLLMMKRDGNMGKTLFLVIPCYNEEEVLPKTNRCIGEKLRCMIDKGLVSEKSRIMYVNDGSKDRTWEVIQELCDEDELVTGITLSRNRGHQNALLAGLMTAKEYADMVISMDADMQDDVDVIEDFVVEYEKGNDIVYGVRKSRKKDTLFKKYTALAFYKLMRLFGVDIVYNHADYRLMSKRALEGLAQFREVNLFLRGIVPMIGYKTSTVLYDRGERAAGESKYPLKKMIMFAVEGITSCSVKPIRMITAMGFLVSVFSVFYLIYILIGNAMGNTVQGWTTVVAVTLILGGFQIFSIGIVGEYISKIYLEVKDRPRYIIEDSIIK